MGRVRGRGEGKGQRLEQWLEQPELSAEADVLLTNGKYGGGASGQQHHHTGEHRVPAREDAWPRGAGFSHCTFKYPESSPKTGCSVSAQ